MKTPPVRKNGARRQIFKKLAKFLRKGVTYIPPYQKIGNRNNPRKKLISFPPYIFPRSFWVANLIYISGVLVSDFNGLGLWALKNVSSNIKEPVEPSFGISIQSDSTLIRYISVGFVFFIHTVHLTLILQGVFDWLRLPRVARMARMARRRGNGAEGADGACGSDGA